MLKPNVKYANSRNRKFDKEHVGGMLCNPIYAGLGSIPPVISDEVWIMAAKKLIEEWGVEQFLVNMLYCLRMSIDSCLEVENAPASDSNSNPN